MGGKINLKSIKICWKKKNPKIHKNPPKKSWEKQQKCPKNPSKSSPKIVKNIEKNWGKKGKNGTKILNFPLFPSGEFGAGKEGISHPKKTPISGNVGSEFWDKKPQNRDFSTPKKLGFFNPKIGIFNPPENSGFSHPKIGIFHPKNGIFPPPKNWEFSTQKSGFSTQKKSGFSHPKFGFFQPQNLDFQPQKSEFSHPKSGFFHPKKNRDFPTPNPPLFLFPLFVFFPREFFWGENREFL